MDYHPLLLPTSPNSSWAIIPIAGFYLQHLILSAIQTSSDILLYPLHLFGHFYDQIVYKYFY